MSLLKRLRRLFKREVQSIEITQEDKQAQEEFNRIIKEQNRNKELFEKIVGESVFDQIDWIINNGLNKYHYWNMCYQEGSIYNPSTVSEPTAYDKAQSFISMSVDDLIGAGVTSIETYTRKEEFHYGGNVSRKFKAFHFAECRYAEFKMKDSSKLVYQFYENEFHKYCLVTQLGFELERKLFESKKKNLPAFTPVYDYAFDIGFRPASLEEKEQFLNNSQAQDEIDNTINSLDEILQELNKA